MQCHCVHFVYCVCVGTNISCVCVQGVFLELKAKFESGAIEVSDSEEEGEGEGEGELDSAASDDDDGKVMQWKSLVCTVCILCAYVCITVRSNLRGYIAICICQGCSATPIGSTSVLVHSIEWSFTYCTILQNETVMVYSCHTCTLYMYIRDTYVCVSVCYMCGHLSSSSC